MLYNISMNINVTDADFDLFSKLIYKESGISFSDVNRTILEGRLRTCLNDKKLETLAELYKLITTNTEEMKWMLDSVTTNLTRFFRNQPHFDTLINYVIPKTVAKKRAQGKTNIKVWSAGCSTGEEPYTIAMVLKEHLPPNMTFQILASDISLKSILTAKQGYYPQNKCEGIPPNYLAKYFTKTDGGYQINEDLKNTIRFDYHNLKNSSSTIDNDVVFCRNVLIYFDLPAQTTTVNCFYNSMESDSYLYIGHSESLFGMDTKFEFLKTDWACIYHKK